MPPKSESRSSLKAWLVVVAAFTGAFVSFGVTYTFGVFLRPISTTFGVTHATMSGLFAVIAALTFFLAPFTGEIADHHGPRAVVAFGGVLMGVSLVVGAHAQTFWMIVLTYGVGLGTAAACVYIPAISAVGESFETRRDIALGISISGIGCGTLVAAPVFGHVDRALRLARRDGDLRMGGRRAVAAGCRIADSSSRCGGEEEGRISEELRTPAFKLLYVSLTFAGVAVFVSLVYMPVYAADIGVGRVAGAAVIGYIGAASVVGRLGLNALAPRFGLMFMFQVAYAILLLVSHFG